MMVIVSGGFSERMRRISRWEEWGEGLKRVGAVGVVWVVEAAAVVIREGWGGGVKRARHVSLGVWCGCY